MEWIFVDGVSTDDTVSRISLYSVDFSQLIIVLENHYKIVSYSMNIGIKASKGKNIVRFVAHAEC